MVNPHAQAKHNVDATDVTNRDPLAHHPVQHAPDAPQGQELGQTRRAGGSWIERLRACKVQPPLTVAPDMARRLTRAGVPESIVAQLPPDFQSDPWLPKLVSLPGVPYNHYEYLSTKMVFIALGEHSSAYKAVRLAKVMQALGWERCKLYPHLGFGRTVVRGFRRVSSRHDAVDP